MLVFLHDVMAYMSKGALGCHQHLFRACMSESGLGLLELTSARGSAQVRS